MTVVIQGSPETISLPAGHALSVVAAALAVGRVWPITERLGDTPGLTAVASGETVTLGPYATVRRFQIETLTGSLSYSSAPVDFPTADEVATAKSEAIAAAAAAQFTVVGAVGDLCEVVGDGAPEDSVQSFLSVNPTGDDNALLFTAKTAGVAGDDITVEYVDPSANDAVLSVSVTGTDIVVSLATDAEGVITSTAADILAEVEATEAADALVAVTVDTSDSGSADDGSGVVTALSAAPLADGAGVAAGTAGIGSRYSDITNGALYMNTGTKAVPVWEQLAFVA